MPYIMICSQWTATVQRYDWEDQQGTGVFALWPASVHKPVWWNSLLWSGQHHRWWRIKAWIQVFRATDCVLQGTGTQSLAPTGSVQCLNDVSFLLQLEAIVQDGGNDGSITDIDALNVRIDNQVCCTSLSWAHNSFFFYFCMAYCYDTLTNARRTKL
jgi:hypothetical protein